MSFRGQITFSDSNGAIARYGSALGAQAKKRSMSNKRLFASAFALFLGLFLSYCSLFYLPAFASDSQILRLSSADKVSPKFGYGEKRKDGWFTPYLDLLRMQRGYMSAGSKVEALFVTSDPANVTFAVTRCKSAPIIEIFSCTPVDDSRVTVESRNNGLVSFTIDESGFYHVTEAIHTDPDTYIDFNVIWRRK